MLMSVLTRASRHRAGLHSVSAAASTEGQPLAAGMCITVLLLLSTIRSYRAGGCQAGSF